MWRAYGRAMNTFCGCDTETLTDLSSVFGERAGHLRALMDGAAGSVRVTAWFGPDAEDFRDRVDKAVEDAIRLIETIRELGELLGKESAQQTSCSQPDEGAGTADDALRSMRAEWPGSVREAEISPLMAEPGAQGWGPMIGGPLAMEDPTSLLDRLPPRPDLEDLAPLLGGPFMAPGPLRPIPQPQPVPDGEEFALDPAILADAQKDRRLGLGAIPIVGTAQMAMGVHDGIGRLLDNTEGVLEGSGLSFATPIVSAARVPHALTGIALGERSVAGQVVDSIDRQLANTVQTTGEVSAAIGDGEWGGAARAAERGFYRHVDAGADVLTATSLPAVGDAGSQIAGSAADVIEPLSPAAAAPLRSIEDASREFVEDLESGHDWLTDGERYYDLRRKYVTMPWDLRT